MHPQLEAFAEVVSRGLVTGAAQALYVTQPALTAPVWQSDVPPFAGVWSEMTGVLNGPTAEARCIRALAPGILN